MVINYGTVVQFSASEYHVKREVFLYQNIYCIHGRYNMMNPELTFGQANRSLIWNLQSKRYVYIYSPDVNTWVSLYHGGLAWGNDSTHRKLTAPFTIAYLTVSDARTPI